MTIVTEDEMNLFEVHASMKRGQTIHLLYRSEDKAKNALSVLGEMREPLTLDDRRGLGTSRPWDSVCTVSDDYGSTVVVDRLEIAMAWYDDMAQNSNGQGEKQLFIARANVRLQKRAAQDQTLKSAQQPSSIVPAGPIDASQFRRN
jgi:hypothetical protein